MDFKPTDALLRIDLLNAFCPGGGLPVPGGDEIVEAVNVLSREVRAAHGIVVDVQDYHPADHGSFAETHGVEPYSTVQMAYGDQTAWPTHAVSGTKDADFHPALDTTLAHLTIRKGMDPKVDSYSAFIENDKITKTGLAGYLRDRGIKRVIVVGLARDFCVGFSALDARSEGFEAVLINDLTRAISLPTDNGSDTNTEMTNRLIDAGVVIH